jgi:hypothetical protein
MFDLGFTRMIKVQGKDRIPEDGLGPLSKQREKGLWNFLTWSFYLSQAIIATQVASGSARASDPADEHSSHNQSDQDGVLGSLPSAQAVLHADTTVPPEAVVINPSWGALPIVLSGAANQDAPIPVIAPHDEPVTANSGDASPTTNASYFTVSAPNGDVVPNHGSNDHLPDTTLPPLGGPVGDVLTPILNQVPPILGAVGDVLEPILHGLPQLVGAVGETLEPILHDLSPVFGGVAGVVDSVAETLIAPVVNDLTQPVASLLGAIAANVVHSSVPIALKSGSIDFDHSVSTGGILTDLFSGGQYTHYNLALHSDAPSPIGNSASIGAGSKLLSLVDHVVFAGGDDHGSQNDHGQSQSVTLPSHIDDLVLRGLGDGITV